VDIKGLLVVSWAERRIAGGVLVNSNNERSRREYKPIGLGFGTSGLMPHAFDRMIIKDKAV